ncbi:MAG: hypothetical protein KDA61_21545, partial [Planctomycetales bacterium]|nr:hypothetical protein [Planctomycetales bacterium]
MTDDELLDQIVQQLRSTSVAPMPVELRHAPPAPLSRRRWLALATAATIGMVALWLDRSPIAAPPTRPVAPSVGPPIAVVGSLDVETPYRTMLAELHSIESKLGTLRDEA